MRGADCGPQSGESISRESASIHLGSKCWDIGPVEKWNVRRLTTER